jgi:hypothetical protein
MDSVFKCSAVASCGGPLYGPADLHMILQISQIRELGFTLVIPLFEIFKNYWRTLVSTKTNISSHYLAHFFVGLSL